MLLAGETYKHFEWGLYDYITEMKASTCSILDFTWYQYKCKSYLVLIRLNSLIRNRIVYSMLDS